MTPPNDEGTHRFRGLPISVVLTSAICFLVAVAVAAIYIVGYEIARSNTAELARDKGEILIHSIQERVHDHLTPVREQLEYLSLLMERDGIGLGRRNRLGDLLIASLAAVPQVSVIAFVDRNLQTLRAFRYRRQQPIELSDWADDPALKKTISEAAEMDGVFWGGFFVAESVGLTFLNLVLPIRTKGQFVGALVAGVSIHDLSQFLALAGGDYAKNVFILYGKDRVVAHPSILETLPAVSDIHPLPRVEAIKDPVLDHIWASNRRREIEANFANEIEARVVEVAGDSYVFLFREYVTFGDQPWTIGTYLKLADLAPQLDRLGFIPKVGLVVLVVALLTGALLSAGFSRPIRRLAEGARRIGVLDFDRVSSVPPGIFRELNDAVDAFNAMIKGLRLFERYVPRTHVHRLVQEGAEDASASRECDVTIMFTDVVGFTSIAESLPVSDVADFLNHHFLLVDRCVEAEDGIVDKYIGDAVMAVWGDSPLQRDHALRACRAAIAISRAIRDDNARLAQSNLPPLRLRIGIHSGRVILGNVGAPGRINYTVIGDAVNTAERLEGLARELADESDEVFTVVSGQTAKQLGSDIALVPLGEHELRGRHGHVDAYCLPND